MTNIFLCVESIIYISFLLHGFIYSESAFSINLKFLSIIIVFLYSISLWLCKKSQSHTLSISFLFLVCADYFLLIKESYVWGLACFLIVQFCFFIYLKRNYQWLVALISCIVIASGIMIFHQPTVLVLAVIYFALFTHNLLLAWIQYKEETCLRKRLFSIGMSLYYLCDIQVGIFNMSDYIPVTGKVFQLLYEFSVHGMWMFYLPGVVFIAVSNQRTLYGKKQ